MTGIQNGLIGSFQNSIVTSGLQLYLDAANTTSYPGTGTTWTDLSGNARNGTLTNGPTFNSANNGSIVFDGVDDFSVHSIPSTAITNITMTGFVNVTLARKGAFFRNGNGANGYAIGIGSTTFDANGNNIIVLLPGVRWSATTTSWNSGWQMVTFILNASSVISGYKNLESITFPTGTNPIAPTSNLYLGRNVGDEPSGARAANCGIGVFMFYNRVLSLQEITQNYDALKGRYSL
jgi:hypothetical protein